MAPYTFIEVLEHRIDGDRVAVAPHVHHRNRDKTDNRPDNLEPIGASEHAREHHRPKIDYEEAWRVYCQGFSTPEVGRRFGVNSGTLSRNWRKMGYTLRSVGDGQRAVTRRGIDVDRVREMHLAGMRSTPIAAELGTTREVVRAIIGDLGLQPHRTGRPPV